MSITKHFLEGAHDDFGRELPDHIVTIVSNVFVFDDKVYKIYKSDSEFFNKNFNDLSNKQNRFKFTRKDFDWNNRLTPEVYIKLSGVVLENNGIKFVEPTDEAEELVIEMNKVDMKYQLIKLLVDDKITLDDCFEIGKQLGERAKNLFKLTPQKTTYEDFLERFKDVDPWIGNVKEISSEESRKYIKFVEEFLQENKDKFDTKELMGTCMDIHADNAVYVNNNLLPIDTYAPKEGWLHGYKYLNLYRLATDIYGFLGKEGFNKVIEGYQTTTANIIPREFDKFLIIYCNLINWPYQYMLSEKELWRKEVAKKYGEVIKQLYDSN